jgi:hypothetical protein
MCTNTYLSSRCPRLCVSASDTTTSISKMSEHTIMCTKPLSQRLMFSPLPFGTKHQEVTQSNAGSIFKNSIAHSHVCKKFLPHHPMSSAPLLFLFLRARHLHIYIYIQNSSTTFYVYNIFLSAAMSSAEGHQRPKFTKSTSMSISKIEQLNAMFTKHLIHHSMSSVPLFSARG